MVLSYTLDTFWNNLITSIVLHRLFIHPYYNFPKMSEKAKKYQLFFYITILCCLHIQDHNNIIITWINHLPNIKKNRTMCALHKLHQPTVHQYNLQSFFRTLMTNNLWTKLWQKPKDGSFTNIFDDRLYRRPYSNLHIQLQLFNHYLNSEVNNCVFSAST